MSFLIPRSKKWRQCASALIIVLAFVVLLTGLVVAYFSRATTDRQLSSASFNNTASDLLARSALDIAVSDFKQEIANAIAAGPPTATNMVPARSGNVATIPNLIRRSRTGDTLAIPSRASNVNSTLASVNGRSVTVPRWNSHYLMSSSQQGNFTAPDWVLMMRNGPAVDPFGTSLGSGATALYNPIATNTNYVVGRYAYAVYDEGGLLDMNMAGYPYPNGTGATPSVTDIGRKGIITFADLMGVSGTPTIMSDIAVNYFVLFRNYATTDSSKTFANTPINFSSLCSNLPGKGFINYYLGGNDLPACTVSPQTGTTQDFGQVNRISSVASGAVRTDQNFISRQELIKFRSSSANIASTDTLQYLGTFSREQNKPSVPQTRTGSQAVFPQRFYMGLFANLIPNPGSTSATSILANFGLHWNPSGFWEYWGPNGTGKQSAIPAISTTGGPIDFFQYLDYALHPTWNGTSPDSANINSTLTIGAAIIDQCHPIIDLYSSTGSLATGSTTTRIDYSGGTGTVYGMKNFDPNPPPIPPAVAVPSGYYCLNRPFRSVGEMGYAYNISTGATLDLKDAPPSRGGTNNDAGILDFFTYNCPGTGTNPIARSGVFSLNTGQFAVLKAVLTGALRNDWDAWSNSPLSAGGTTPDEAGPAATDILAKTASTTLSSRADIAWLASSSVTTHPPFSTNVEETRETIARALAEVGQTRTWGLLIDLIAQTGHYNPSSASGPNTSNPLANFTVDGEKRYWLHVAIDRFDGTIVGQQLEEVLE